MTDTGLKARIQSDLHDAMRAHDTVRSGTLRMVLTSVTNAEVAGREARRLGEDEVLAVIRKEAKKRREAATAYTGAGRLELAEREEAELVVLSTYLPAELGDAELAGIVTRAVAETGATGMPDLGRVMKVAQAQVAGRADGGRVVAAVRAALAG
ncbi:MAG TPA: GatB/YqeY domain-containing protein [Dermatophilaceae bacterium]|nr:GatB/YqeY domain-containing protein [Dermatophilaceae bacterium]